MGKVVSRHSRLWRVRVRVIWFATPGPELQPWLALPDRSGELSYTLCAESRDDAFAGAREAVERSYGSRLRIESFHVVSQ